MHMSNTLVSPSVGAAFWAVSSGLAAYCAHRVRHTMQTGRASLMGVLGAFVFAVQMINFSIPGTGSSGHFCGGLMLAVLLGPHAAFLVMTSVLTVQCLFFADGGLLALGCNIFNMAFWPSFVAWPLYRAVAKEQRGNASAWGTAFAASIIGLSLGAFSVVLETAASGITELPFSAFTRAMLPIHLAIGAVEGIISAAVITGVSRALPEASPEPLRLRPVLWGMALAAVVIGGTMSWFASSHPDGLEWSIAKVTGQEEVLGSESDFRGTLSAFQEKTAFLPDYGFKTGSEMSQPMVKAGTSVSGLVGGGLTLGLALLTGLALRARPELQKV